MSSLILHILALFLAQTPQLPAEGAQIFRIIFEDGTERYGAVEESGMQVKIYYDTPWAPQPPESILKRKIKLEELTSALRQSRQKDEAAKMGYELVKTDYGETWLQRSEIEYADRAKVMVLKQRDEEAAQIAATPPPIAQTAKVEEKKPTIIAQYGLHAAIALAGLVLSALILKTMVLSE